ncbi:S-adenosyl-L-methionine-dependent methyltransferase [Linnemannia elongata]|nr:S-adenosyl-L-methionine-dependent methyltransferase [Linnemannia elongata]
MTPEEKEQQYVHSVYQAIAPHFSATRYKPWPVVEEFLKTMPVGYVGADVGCGNGKYIGVNDKLFMVGSDRSSNLISICSERGHEAMVCDGLALPYRSQFFDFAISIAVIHHFISPERRVAAIEEILRIVRVGGRVLIFVWALEQTGKRDFDKETQDVFVPWALAKKPIESKKSSETKKPKANSRPQGAAAPVYNRYYHLFHKGELEDLVLQTNKASIVQQGYDRDNWWCILEKTRHE